MDYLISTIAIAVFARPAMAHMVMTSPPALRAPENTQYNSSTVDQNYFLPLRADSSDFPCKGYSEDVPGLSTATATLEPGSNFTVSLKGLTTYEGGSCQFSLSYDGGTTWGAIKSIVGNCPSATEVDYTFVVPEGLPDANNVLFAWTWFNNFGNRNMFMNCASVDVLSPPGTTPQETYKAPRMFEANIYGGMCRTMEGEPVDFEQPELRNCAPELLVTPDKTVTFGNAGAVPGPTITEGDGHSEVPETTTSSPPTETSADPGSTITESDTTPEPTTKPESTTSPASTATSVPGPGAWAAERIYVGGDKACEGGVIYTAKWWTQGEKPGTTDVWTKGGAC